MRTASLVTILITGFLSPSLFGYWQDQPTRDEIIRQLQQQYALTKLTADRTAVVTAGAVLKLKKDGLVMAPSTSTDVSGNAYRVGKITQSTTGKVNEKANKVKGIFGHIPLAGASISAPTVATRTFVAGEKLNVTKIDVKDAGVVFELYSADAYADTYYRASLTFPVEKGHLPSAADMLAIAGDVFAVIPAEDSKTESPAPQQGGGGAPPSQPVPPTALSSQPATQVAPQDPAPQKFEDIPPPPPPTADTPQPNLKVGQTVDQVTAQLGQPVNKVTAGDKQIYLFKDWKVTFIKGKVTDIVPR
jgi:hypothetical protein